MEKMPLLEDESDYTVDRLTAGTVPDERE